MYTYIITLDFSKTDLAGNPGQPDEIYKYIGSTKRSLLERLACHIIIANHSYDKGKRLNRFQLKLIDFIDKYGSQSIIIEELEHHTDIIQMRISEDHKIAQLKNQIGGYCLNTIRAYVPIDEKQPRKLMQYQAFKGRSPEKYISFSCPCGGSYTHYYKKQHDTSKKHKRHLQAM